MDAAFYSGRINHACGSIDPAVRNPFYRNCRIPPLQKQRISFRHISGCIGQEKGGAGADDAQSTGRHCLSCGVHADARESSAAAYGDGQCRGGV